MKDLAFLQNADSEDLKVLVDYLTKDEDGGFRMTEELSNTWQYRKFYPDQLQVMWEDIANELMRYAGNSFVNFFRRHGVSYREVLCDVCKKMKVDFNPESSVDEIESNLLQTVLQKSVEDMSPDELKEFVKEMNIPTTGLTKQALLLAATRSIKLGGFAVYKYAPVVTNAVSKFILRRGLSVVANASLNRGIAMFAGPIGLSLTAIWAAYDIAGPAYRVTIPAVIHIAYMRTRVNYEKSEDIKELE